MKTIEVTIYASRTETIQSRITVELRDGDNESTITQRAAEAFDTLHAPVGNEEPWSIDDYKIHAFKAKKGK